MTPERQRLQCWLAGALRGTLVPGRAALLRHLPAAEHEGVAALLRERYLSQQPAPGADRLHQRSLHEAALDLVRGARLREVLDALAASGVPVLVFKGGALAHSHYPRPELRSRDDTDLLIAPRHLDAADATLAALGFDAAPGNEGALIMRQRLYRARDATGLVHNVDLHWAVSNSARASAFAPRTLMARAVPIPALGPHGRGPDAVDALLLAALHLDAHHVDDPRLIWLYDVHLLLQGMDRAARASTCQRARAAGLERACAWVLAATRARFATSLSGLDSLLDTHPLRAPSSRRGAQWLRELACLPDARTRTAWLMQHAFPERAHLNDRSDAPLPMRHARRLLRGVSHLLRGAH